MQLIFQSLGLKSLLADSLPVENFTHAIIHRNDYTAIVIKRKGSYLTLLIDPKGAILDDNFLIWAKSFDAAALRNNPNFQVI